MKIFYSIFLLFRYFHYSLIPFNFILKYVSTESRQIQLVKLQDVIVIGNSFKVYIDLNITYKLFYEGFISKMILLINSQIRI